MTNGSKTGLTWGSRKPANYLCFVGVAGGARTRDHWNHNPKNLTSPWLTPFVLSNRSGRSAREDAPPCSRMGLGTGLIT